MYVTILHIMRIILTSEQFFGISPSHKTISMLILFFITKSILPSSVVHITNHFDEQCHLIKHYLIKII